MVGQHALYRIALTVVIDLGRQSVPIPPVRNHHFSPETSPHPLRPTFEISEKQDSEAAKETDFAHQRSFESSKEVPSLKFSNPRDFEKVIQDLDSDIHCFDKVEASPIGPNNALPITKQVNPSHPAHSPGPTLDFSPS